jgi:hypothetical protein
VTAGGGPSGGGSPARQLFLPGDTRALFRLGEAADVERLEVRWASGKVTMKEQPEVDRYLDMSE